MIFIPRSKVCIPVASHPLSIQCCQAHLAVCTADIQFPLDPEATLNALVHIWSSLCKDPAASGTERAQPPIMWVFLISSLLLPQKSRPPHEPGFPAPLLLHWLQCDSALPAGNRKHLLLTLYSQELNSSDSLLLVNRKNNWQQMSLSLSLSQRWSCLSLSMPSYG